MRLHFVLFIQLFKHVPKYTAFKNFYYLVTDLSHGFTLSHTSSLPFSQSYGRFFISHAFKNFEQIFSQIHSFLKKQTQGVHSNVNKEHISSMINKNKTSIWSSLSLSWALLFIMLVKTHIDVPFQWKTSSDLLKTAKNFTAKYNRPHSSK